MAFRFLLQSDHANNSTSFEDSSPDARTITVVGNTKHSTTAGSPFSGISSSVYFDGTGDRMEVVMPNVNTLSALTVDTFYNFSGSYGTIGMYGDNSSESALYSNTLRVIAAFQTGTAINGQATTIAQNTWQHYALSWDGTNVYLFLNGILQASATRGSYDSTLLWIGAYKSATDSVTDYPTYITNFAVRDECVWSGSGYSVGDTVFTPPTEPYTITATGGKPLIHGFNTPLINSGLLIRGIY